MRYIHVSCKTPVSMLPSKDLKPSLLILWTLNMHFHLLREGGSCAHPVSSPQTSRKLNFFQMPEVVSALKRGGGQIDQPAMKSLIDTPLPTISEVQNMNIF